MTVVVLDTNIYISAILFGGKPEMIWKKIKDGRIEAATSNFILDELSAVLRQKFNWSPNQVKETLKEIKEFTELVYPQKKISVITEHKADNKILECALEAKADFLVSGDKHLLKIKKFRNIRIIKPDNLLRELA